MDKPTAIPIVKCRSGASSSGMKTAVHRRILGRNGGRNKRDGAGFTESCRQSVHNAATIETLNNHQEKHT